MRNFITEGLRQFALGFYQENSFNNEGANWFFETFFPGQKILIQENLENGEKEYFSEQAYERFYDYEEMLNDLYLCDSDKYYSIHKGTPFFFMAWISYLMKNFDQALFYLDAAISEDSKNGSDDWMGYPAGKFLLLKSEGHSAIGTVEEIIKILNQQFSRFNDLQNLEIFNIEIFRNSFVNPIIAIKENRTLITSIYTFFLEYPLHLRQLDLRSLEGGTIYPFINHLFKGGLIFETLTRMKYPLDEQGKPYISLNGIFRNKDFIDKYGEINATSAYSLDEVVSNITDESLKNAFRITVMTRNTVGHNLIRDDAFGNKNNFIKLFEQEVNAILYFIQNEYL